MCDLISILKKVIPYVKLEYTYLHNCIIREDWTWQKLSAGHAWDSSTNQLNRLQTGLVAYELQ